MTNADQTGQPLKPERILWTIPAALCTLFFGFLFIVSQFFTTDCSVLDPGSDNEHIAYLRDFLPLNLLVLAAGIFLILRLLPKLTVFSPKIWCILMSVWTIGFGCIWIHEAQSAPSYDSMEVTQAGLAFASGDYARLHEDYLQNYPFQLGFAFFVELCARLLHPFSLQTMLWLEYLNVFFVAGTQIFLYLLSRHLWADEQGSSLCALFFMLTLPPLLLCTFTYGLIPGLFFCALALWAQAAFFRKEKLLYGLISAIAIGIAVLVKPNCLIILVAMSIVGLLHLLRRRHLIQESAVLALGIALSLLLSPGVQRMYEMRSGIQMGDSIPQVSWFAMGMSEAYNAPGWYNISLSVYNFDNCGRDAQAAAEGSRDVIRERLATFRHNPGYCLSFFCKKTVSQWNETTYQSIWSTQVRPQYDQPGTIREFVCGRGEPGIKKTIDLTAQLIFAGAFICMLLLWRKKGRAQGVGGLVLPICIIGGFLFHTLSEGKSQYILPYYMFMIPPAAYGLSQLREWVGQRQSRKLRRILLGRPAQIPEAHDKSTPEAQPASGSMPT